MHLYSNAFDKSLDNSLVNTKFSLTLLPLFCAGHNYLLSNRNEN